MKSVRYLRIEKRGRGLVVERFAPAMKAVAENPDPQAGAQQPGAPDTTRAVAACKGSGGR